MISRRLALASCLMTLGLVAPIASGADEPKIEGDLKTLQGEWTSKDDQGAESTWTFKGDKLHIKTPGREYKITIKVDAKAKPQKAMEMEVADDSPNAKGTKSPAIYKLDGDKKASICFAAPDKDRPTEFKTDFSECFSFDLTKK